MPRKFHCGDIVKANGALALFAGYGALDLTGKSLISDFWTREPRWVPTRYLRLVAKNPRRSAMATPTKDTP